MDTASQCLHKGNLFVVMKLSKQIVCCHYYRHPALHSTRTFVMCVSVGVCSPSLYILIFTIMKVLKFLMMKIGSNFTTTSMLFMMISYRKFRYLAYRQLAWWGWQHLGRHRCVVHPSCAVGKIRDEFLSPLREYTGHQYPPSTP